MLSRLFLPHNDEKNRSFVLQHSSLAGFAFFIFSLIVASHFLVLSVPNILGYATNIFTSDLLTDTNKMRTNRNLKPLKLNATLSKAAEAKANDMFAKNYWAHVSPDGTEPWDFITSYGYDYIYAGENLAVDFSDSQKVVDAWYNSPSHRENLLNTHYTEIGFAVVNGELQGRKTTLVVQMFGFSRSELASAELSPEVSIPVVDSKPFVKSLAIKSEGKVLNSSDVFNASRYIAIILGLFLTAFFAIDGYYVRKMRIFRVSGHTILHILVLLLAIAGIWYTSIGLVL